MEYKVLYRKYRPSNFNDLVGQDHIKELLLHSILNKKLSHAYIFSGPRGTGKTSTAKLMAKAVNCLKSNKGNPCEKCVACKTFDESIDVVEIDAASNNGVDEIRELRENIKIMPSFSKYKIYIIDEVHMLSSSAWNAFLKTLEEPPTHIIFILATTEIQKIPITVMSRCQRFDFKKINSKEIIQKVKEIAEVEKIKISDEAIEEISILSDGSLRDSLSILDQLSKSEKEITIESLSTTYGIITSTNVKEIFKEYNNGNINELINLIENLNQKGVSGDNFLNKTLNYLLDQLVSKKSGEKVSITNLEDLIFDLEECYKKANKYLVIKASMIKNIDTINQKEEIIVKKEEQIISREIILPDLENKIDKKRIEIRINNSFVDADKELKKEFSKKWQGLINSYCNNGETKYLSLLKNAKVEVVSPTNVLLSTDSESNSLLFNLISDDLSLKCKKELGLDLKMVCLDLEQWQKERAEYIKNNKVKKYEYMKEPKKDKKEKSLKAASEIFGEDLIEVD